MKQVTGLDKAREAAVAEFIAKELKWAWTPSEGQGEAAGCKVWVLLRRMVFGLECLVV